MHITKSFNYCILSLSDEINDFKIRSKSNKLDWLCYILNAKGIFLIFKKTVAIDLENPVFKKKYLLL